MKMWWKSEKVLGGSADRGARSWNKGAGRPTEGKDTESADRSLHVPSGIKLAQSTKKNTWLATLLALVEVNAKQACCALTLAGPHLQCHETFDAASRKDCGPPA